MYQLLYHWNKTCLLPTDIKPACCLLSPSTNYRLDAQTMWINESTFNIVTCAVKADTWPSINRRLVWMYELIDRHSTALWLITTLGLYMGTLCCVTRHILLLFLCRMSLFIRILLHRVNFYNIVIYVWGSTWVKKEVRHGHFKSCRRPTMGFYKICRKWRQCLTKCDMATQGKNKTWRAT